MVNNTLTFSQRKFLGAFAKLQKATISFVMSVRPSLWNNSASTGQYFIKFHVSVFFSNLWKKFKFYSNLTKITSTLREDFGRLW